MKLYRLFTVTAAAVALASTASAQGKGAGAPKAPHVTTSAPKAGGTATHGKSADAGSKKPTTTASSSRGGGKAGKGGSTSTSDDSTTSTGTTAAADAPEPNAVSIQISKNPAQLAKIQPQLDALGLTLEEATQGFRTQGLFIAALNASKNRGLDFLALQEAMAGGMSLGQAAKKVANTPPAPEAPEGDTGTTGTGTTGTGTTGTGTTGTGTTGTGTTGTGTSTGSAQ